MSSAIKTFFKYRNGETKTQNNIGDGIPEAPTRSWFQEVKSKITRSGNAHEHPSASVAPLSGVNGPIRTTGPITGPQQSDGRDTEPTGIELSPVSRPSLPEASRASDSALVQDSLKSTDAQAALQPSVAAQETISANAEDIAAPDAGDTPAMPLGKKAQTHNLSSTVVSEGDTTTAVDDIVPAMAQMSSSTTRDIAPVYTQMGAVEQESKVRDHNSKQKQNVSTEPVNREDSDSQRERSVKRNVHQILEHQMRGYERVQIAILVDIEDYKGSRRICVKCFDGAVHKADEIETILSRNGTSLRGYSYVVHRRGGTKIFGYKGPDIDHIDDAIDIDSERSRDHPALPFSNTPYWTRGSKMVEVFCGDEKHGNMTGAPIRMTTTRRDGSLAVSLWTCGGIIKVGETNYGLTTAHPLMLSNSFRPRDPPHEMLSNEDADMTQNLIVDGGPFGGKDDFFSAEHHPQKYWQAIGKVSHYALAKTGSIPSNNDWLLFELPKDRFMWNLYGSNSIRDDPWEITIRNGRFDRLIRGAGAIKNSFRNTTPSRHTLAVFTARGPLAAHILEGTAFLILGNSSFEVLKIGLREPLRPGDSGSWLMRGGELIGVMVAGSEEQPERPIGYAISAQEVYRSISTSMGGLSVRPLTALENSINANNQTGGSQRDLAVLRVRQLFDVNAPVRRIKTLSDHHTLSLVTSIQTGNAALTALLRLGFFCAKIGLDFPTNQKSRLTTMPSWNRIKRIGEWLHQKMSQLSEGLAVTHLILALSASLPLSETRARTRECARTLSVLMEELNITPLPAQSHLRALVESVRHRYDLPGPLDVHYGGPKEATSPTNLARSLGRAMYAIRTHNFFVHEGVTARYLRKFIRAYTRYPVIAFDEKDSADRWTRDLMEVDIVPRIFVAELDRPYSPQNTKSNDSLYGTVVEFAELNDALESLTISGKAQRDGTGMMPM